MEEFGRGILKRIVVRRFGYIGSKRVGRDA